MHNRPCYATSRTYSASEIERCKRFREVTPNGVVYDEELAGPDGMTFILIRESHTTPADINEAAEYLIRQRDVVSFLIANAE